jgi:hypothetical protein
MTFFVGISTALVLRGPLGKALAERIAGRPAPPAAGDLDQAEQLERALADLEEMRHRLAELEERQDFTERVLAAHREPGRLEG